MNIGRTNERLIWLEAGERGESSWPMFDVQILHLKAAKRKNGHDVFLTTDAFSMCFNGGDSRQTFIHISISI